MRQKIIIISGFFIILIAIICILVTNRKKIEPKYLSLKTDYVDIFKNEDKKLDIMIYSNKPKASFLFKENISRAIIYSKDDNSLRTLKLVDIKKDIKTRKLDKETYYAFIFNFIVPKSSPALKMNDTILKLSLHNSEEYKFEIGNINIIDKSEFKNPDNINVAEYNATKDEESCRIDKIKINFESLKDININEVSLGNDQELTYEVKENNLTVNIPHSNLILNKTPVFVKYTYKEKEYEYMIDTFTYFKPYDELNESENLIYETKIPD